MLLGHPHHTGGGGHHIGPVLKFLPSFRMDHHQSVGMVLPGEFELIQHHVIVDVTVSLPGNDVVTPRPVDDPLGQIPVRNKENGLVSRDGVHHLHSVGRGTADIRLGLYFGRRLYRVFESQRIQLFEANLDNGRGRKPGED